MSEAVHVVSETDRAHVLLNPTRLAIMERLREPGSAASLARKLDLPRQRVNYHLRELESHRLVALIEERRRGSITERIYQRTAESYAIAIEAIGNVGTVPEKIADRFSSSYQIAHASRVISDLSALREGAAKAGKSLPTFLLELDVRFATAAARNEFTAELSEFVIQLAQQYHDAETPGGRVFRIYHGAYPKRKKQS